MTIKRCKVHYRKLRREGGLFPKDKTLSTAISEALQHESGSGKIIEKATHRIAEVPGATGHQRLLNDIVIRDNYVFGDICLFATGQMQALLRTAATESTAEVPDNPTLAEVLAALEIAEAKAPSGHEYLHAISYWLAIDDHFYQIQHTSLQAKSVEEYLTWLLRDKTSAISTNHCVLFDVKFDREQVGQDLGEIKSVEVGGIVPETISPPPEAQLVRDDSLTAIDVESTSTIAEKLGARLEKAKKIISELLGDVEAQKLIESVPDEASLEVTVNIGYRSKKRKFNKDFMSNLASGLRNIPDGEIRIRGKDGEIRGDDARLSADMNVKKLRAESSLLDLHHVEEQLLEVHRRFMHDGKISMEEG